MPSIEVLAIGPPRKSSYLAESSVKITLEDGESFVIADLRIIRNKNTQLWVAMPTYSIKDGAAWKYLASIELSRRLRRQLEDVVIAAYEARQAVRS
jgi:DNA-binding cell septation regulator SpoVG